MINKEKNQSLNADEIDLLALFKALQFNYLTISISTVIFIFIAGIYCFMAAPIYQANATLQYDKANQASLLDQMNDVMPFGSHANPVESEVEVIKSRMVLGKTVSDLNLDIQISPSGLLPKLSRNTIAIDIGQYHLPSSLMD